MTEIGISKALALAIGWKRMLPNPEADGLKQCWVWTGHSWRIFDYRDWNVIGPIAAKYDCFPRRSEFGDWNVVGTDLVLNSVWNEDTPQKAIALAVIGAKSNDLTKDEILAMAREASIVIPTRFSHDRTIDELERFATLCRAPLVAEIETLRYELDAVAEIKQERDALRAELGQYPEIQAMLMSENKQLRAEVEAFDKAEDSWMRKAIELEAEVAKLRGLVSGRSAEYLAAHITYDKGYQEGRLDAESLNIPVAEVGVSTFTWLGDRPPAGTTLYRIDQL